MLTANVADDESSSETPGKCRVVGTQDIGAVDDADTVSPQVVSEVSGSAEIGKRPAIAGLYLVVGPSDKARSMIKAA
jgi:hypothetical protein